MFLILSILTSTLLFAIFKLFPRFKINTFQAIVTNYLVAFCTGITTYSGPTSINQAINSGWFTGALILGLVFIIVFNIMAYTTQKLGITTVSVASKMSVIIPITFGVFFLNEQLGILKTTGIVIALIAVYLASSKSNNPDLKNKNFILPILIVLGSGIIDTSLKYMESTHVPKTDAGLFSSVIFSIAFILGLISLAFLFFYKQQKIELKNIIAGIILGIPNYFSIYFLVEALRTPNLDSGTIFTLNNVAIVLTSTIIGVLFFKEKLSIKNWTGIVLALIAIIIMTIK